MNPIGLPVISSAATTPMRPSGATLMTSASWRKLPSWTMSTVSMRAIINGTWAMRAALLCSLFSTVPPTSRNVPAGIDLRTASIAPPTRWFTEAASTPGMGWASTVMVGRRPRRQT